MGYVRTAGMSTAARRARRRAALVLATLLLGLLAVFLLALASVQGWVTLPGLGGAPDEAAVTTSATPPELEPGDVTVNVYNATDTAGLAGRAAEVLRSRGFLVDGVANDPEGAEVPGVAVIRHGPEGARAAEVLQESLPEGVELEPVESEADTVDLVLGEEWQDITTGGDDDTEEG